MSVVLIADSDVERAHAIADACQRAVEAREESAPDRELACESGELEWASV